MKPTPREIETLDVRRAVVADADQIRYRVYSSPIEFVAVIADSALMAVKMAGMAIEAKKMAAVKIPEKFSLPTEKVIDKTGGKTDLAPPPPTIQSQFVPMDVVSLQHKQQARARILPPDMLYDIIETHVREAMASPAKRQPQAVVEPVPEADVVAPAEMLDEEMSILSAPTVVLQEQVVTQMANEILPPSTETPVTAAPEGASLSSDDVEKLLNDQ